MERALADLSALDARERTMDQPEAGDAGDAADARALLISGARHPSG